MSGSIFIRPVLKNKKYISCSNPSSTRQVIEEVFYELPITLNKDDLPVLLSMATYKKYAEWNEDENPFQEIVDAIEKYDEIEIGMDY